jgi:HEPN domain-containing protein
MMNVNVSFLANEYSGFSNLCAFACQQAAQAAALATDRLPKAWQPAIPIYGL